MRSAGGGLPGALRTVSLGLTGGLLFTAAGIPAGGVIGAVTFVGGHGLLTGRGGPLPRGSSAVAAGLMGTVIGSMLTRSTLVDLGSGVLWAVAFTVAILAVGLLAAWPLRRWTGMDQRTAILAACPGGMAEMSLLAQQLGADAPTVLGVHLIRKLLALLALVTLLLAIGGAG